MRIFNRRHILLLVFALLIAGQLALPLTASAARAITITIYFGKPPDCRGFGICKITLDWKAAPPVVGAGEERKAKAPKALEGEAVLKENKLYVDFKNPLPERAEVLPVAANIVLDAPTARGLGARNVTVLKGDYKIDYSKNKFGSVVLNLESRN